MWANPAKQSLDVSLTSLLCPCEVFFNQIFIGLWLADLWKILVSLEVILSQDISQIADDNLLPFNRTFEDKLFFFKDKTVFYLSGNGFSLGFTEFKFATDWSLLIQPDFDERMAMTISFTFLAEVEAGAKPTFESNTSNWLHSTAITPCPMNNIIISFTLFFHILALHFHFSLSLPLFLHNGVFFTIFLLYFFHMFLYLFLKFDHNRILESFWHSWIHKNFRFFVVPTEKNIQIKIILKYDLIIILIKIVNWIFLNMRVHFVDEGVNEMDGGCFCTVEESDLFAEYYFEQHEYWL